MTEVEWLAGSDPKPMLQFLSDKASDRKLRLFAVAVARRCPGDVTDPALAEAVDVAELASDGIVGQDALLAAVRRADSLVGTLFIRDGERPPWNATPVEIRAPMHWAFIATSPGHMHMAALRDCDLFHCGWASKLNRAHQPPVLREIFGNPFRPVTFPPEWRTSTVLALAGQMYESREFGAMPMLADALQDAAL
ncbi:Uncharacterized protein (Fragment) OS=uncultured bacterium PE=4 SV=1 [Gemmata massiliana]|uniref:Uncharacterized protein n=1 Tax=Gemmata massiliana TaxID=1210884 RepID=A0A6P2D1R5_9BACT